MRCKISARLDRRAFLNAFAVGAGLFGASRLFPGRAVADPASAAGGNDPDPSSLQPGQFFWGSDRAPEGPVVIIVSIPEPTRLCLSQRRAHRAFDLLDR